MSERRDEIEARLRKISQGEWLSQLTITKGKGVSFSVVLMTDGRMDTVCYFPKSQGDEDNVKFIANAPEDIRWLLKSDKAREQHMDQYYRVASGLIQILGRSGWCPPRISRRLCEISTKCTSVCEACWSEYAWNFLG